MTFRANVYARKNELVLFVSKFKNIYYHHISISDSITFFKPADRIKIFK